MAATKYEIYCRYFNGNINKCVTNQTRSQWVSTETYEDLEQFYEKNKSAYETLKARLVNHNKICHVEDFTLEERNIYDKCSLYESYQEADRVGLFSPEICKIESSDIRGKSYLENLDTIIEQTDMKNPKYDMIFIYNGLSRVTGDPYIDPNDDNHGQITLPNGNTRSPEQSYIYYDTMKRIDSEVWFLHSVHGSLNSAMTKANELINIMGKQSVKIGKVVPLDKYIEIV